MSVTVQEKAKVIADYQRIKGDTGSPEVQVALLTARIISRPPGRTTTRGAECCGWCRVAASCSTT